MKLLKQFFEVDLRSLALFRVSIGLVVLTDLLIRSVWIKAHYSDWGILPRKLLMDGGLNEFKFSFQLFNGRVEFQIFMFLVAFFFSLLFTLGYKTKITGFVSWVLLVSLTNRNNEIINSGDTILKLMIFWSLFLPIAEVFSIDSALRKEKKKIENYAYFSIPNIFFLLQLCIMYWFSIITKNTQDWVETHLAVYYALHIDQFTNPLAVWIRQYVGLTKGFTLYTLFIEIAGPLLALTPFRWGWLRLVAALLMINLHFGLYMTLEIGIFPWVCMASWLAFFPTCFWELLERVFAKKLNDPITVYYDRDCGFCLKMVKILQSFLIVPNADVRLAQETPETQKMMDENNSWIVKSGENYLFHFDAFLRLLRNSPLFFWLVPVLALPPFFQIGTLMYKAVANNRMRVSILTRHLKETDAYKRPGKFTKTLLTCIFCYILVYLYHSLDVGFRMPKALRGLGKTFSFTQSWSMFASPKKKDGWLVMKGILMDDREVNAWTEEFGEVSFEKPERVTDLFINQRWRKYLSRLAKKRKSKSLKYFSIYICRRWNEKYSHGERLYKLRLYYITERTLPPGEEFEIKKKKIYSFRCGGSRKK